MKKYLVLLLAMLLLFTTFLAACGDSKIDDNSRENNVSETSKNDVSKESGNASESNDPKPDVSKDDASNTSKDESVDVSDSEPVTRELSVYTCRYTEYPYFALVGTCSDGAVITGEANGETVTSTSYKGWFSLRLSCEETSTDVKITQTVDGAQVGDTLKYNATPLQPGPDMWPMVTGKDFQFFLQKMLDDFQGTNLPDETTLTYLSNRVSARLSSLRSVNPDAEIIYIIAPSAMTVYPELVPEEYTPASGKTRLDLTIEALKDGGATVLNLKSAFANHKNDEMPLYYKLDSHWADYGAYIAYTELFNHISQKFPAAKPRPVSDFNWNPKYYQSGDMSYYLATDRKEAREFQENIKEYAYYRMFNVNVPISVTSSPRYVTTDKLSYHNLMTPEKTIRTNNSELPSCLVMRDSFSTQIYDILAERMNTTHYLGMWDYTWDNSRIFNEKPDYVIYILSEWNLDSVING